MKEEKKKKKSLEKILEMKMIIWKQAMKATSKNNLQIKPTTNRFSRNVLSFFQKFYFTIKFFKWQKKINAIGRKNVMSFKWFSQFLSMD